ncbi:MAG: hypothetical protein GF375_04375 [Candidatus Omnitrophica bacterium]|nr:hypothetical protein [Candidatus Omnitrophota bacterium]
MGKKGACYNCLYYDCITNKLVCEECKSPDVPGDKWQPNYALLERQFAAAQERIVKLEEIILEHIKDEKVMNNETIKDSLKYYVIVKNPGYVAFTKRPTPNNQTGLCSLLRELRHLNPTAVIIPVAITWNKELWVYDEKQTRFEEKVLECNRSQGNDSVINKGLETEVRKIHWNDNHLKILRAFDKLGITTIGHLINTTEEEFLKLRNFGKASLRDLKQTLKHFDTGYRLKSL